MPANDWHALRTMLGTVPCPECATNGAGCRCRGVPRVPVEAPNPPSEPGAMPEIPARYRDEPAMGCDGCGAWPTVTRYGDYPGTIGGERERFSLCAECARVLS